MTIPQDRAAPVPVICVPESELAAEIELAIAYTVACNPGRAGELLMTPPGGCRAGFAAQIAAMLAERAARGLSGMTRYETRTGGSRPGETRAD